MSSSSSKDRKLLFPCSLYSSLTSRSWSFRRNKTVVFFSLFCRQYCLLAAKRDALNRKKEFDLNIQGHEGGKHFHGRRPLLSLEVRVMVISREREEDKNTLLHVDVDYALEVSFLLHSFVSWRYISIPMLFELN